MLLALASRWELGCFVPRAQSVLSAKISSKTGAPRPLVCANVTLLAIHGDGVLNRNAINFSYDLGEDG